MGKFFLLSMLFLSAISAQAQGPEWVNFNGRRQVNCFAGYGDTLWIGTDQGLALFDKRTEKLQFLNKNNSGIPIYNIQALFEDHSGGLWVSGRNLELTAYRGGLWESARQRSVDRGSTSSALAVDKHGQAWKWTYDSAYVLRNNNAWEVYSFNSFPDSSLNQIQYNSGLMADDDGTLWIAVVIKANENPVTILYENRGDGWRQSATFDNQNLRLAQIAGKRKYFYAGYWKAVFLDDNGNLVPIDLPENAGLTWIDRKGRILATTVEGIYPKLFYVIRENKVLFTTQTDLSYAFCDTDSSCYLPAGESAAGVKGGNFARIDFRTGIASLYKLYEYNLVAGVTSIVCDKGGRTWALFGDVGGGSKKLAYFDSTWHDIGQGAAAYSNIALDSSQRVWYSRNDMLYSWYDNKERKEDPNNELADILRQLPKSARRTYVAAGLDGTIWIVTNDYYSSKYSATVSSGALIRYDPATGRSKLLCSERGEFSGYYGCHIAPTGEASTRTDTTSILSDGSSCRVIKKTTLQKAATDGCIYEYGVTGDPGLTVYEGPEVRIYKNNNSSIPGNKIWDLIIDKRGHVWMEIFNDKSLLVKFDGKTWKTWSYENSGFPGKGLSSLAVDYRNNIWIGSADGGIAVFREGGVDLRLPVSSEEASAPQNYPNPFSGVTKIPYEVREKSHARVTLDIYNSLGQKVATLLDGERGEGRYEAEFDAQGRAAGIYFYRLTVNGQSSAGQMILARE